MEEKGLSQKQYKTFKFIRGWLTALFVISIIGGAGVAVTLIAVAIVVPFATELTDALFSLAVIILTLIMLGVLLYNKDANRKNIVSGTMLVYVAGSFALSVFNLAAISPWFIMDAYGSGALTYAASSVSYALNICGSAIFLFFAVLLFRKTRHMPNREFPYKLLFIVYIVVLVVSLCIVMAQTYSNMYSYDMTEYAGVIIAALILAGLFMFMSLFPIISVYKALDDEVFYEHFIVNQPGIAISQYERAAFRQAPAQAGYCMNCGQPLQPGAVYCSACGHKVGEKVKSKEDK